MAGAWLRGLELTEACKHLAISVRQCLCSNAPPLLSSLTFLRSNVLLEVPLRGPYCAPGLVAHRSTSAAMAAATPSSFDSGHADMVCNFLAPEVIRGLFTRCLETKERRALVRRWAGASSRWHFHQHGILCRSTTSNSTTMDAVLPLALLTGRSRSALMLLLEH